MYVYINGRIIEKEKAAISPFDHGFLYGLGVFETFRTYEGHPFLLDDHVERLNAGLKELKIEKEFSRQEVLEIINRLSEKNGWENSYIRFNVSAGNGEIGLQTESYLNPSIIVFQKPLSVPGPIGEKEGVILKLKRNTPETADRLKSHHYLNNIAAKREIGMDPNKEGIFLTEDGYIAEGIVSNLFWVKKGQLFTPAVGTGILNGITRQFIISLCSKLNIPVKEGYFTLNELLDAEEAFFTNSIQEIVKVKRIGNKDFLEENGLIKRLFKEYRKGTGRLWSRRELEIALNDR